MKYSKTFINHNYSCNACNKVLDTDLNKLWHILRIMPYVYKADRVLRVFKCVCLLSVNVWLALLVVLIFAVCILVD